MKTLKLTKEQEKELSEKYNRNVKDIATDFKTADKVLEILKEIYDKTGYDISFCGVKFGVVWEGDKVVGIRIRRKPFWR